MMRTAWRLGAMLDFAWNEHLGVVVWIGPLLIRVGVVFWIEQ